MYYVVTPLEKKKMCCLFCLTVIFQMSDLGGKDLVIFNCFIALLVCSWMHDQQLLGTSFQNVA